MPDSQPSPAALYAPMIERDLDSIPVVAMSYLDAHGAGELWLAVSRFAILAYAPSQHSKRAVMACRAVAELGDEEPRVDLIIECASYAARSRQPWSEPPLLDPPPINPDQPRDSGELRAAILDQDRLRAERWLAAHLAEPESVLGPLVRGDALLMLDTAKSLLPRLGEKGRFALFRMPLLEMFASADEDVEDDTAAVLDDLIARVVEERGAVDAVRSVFLFDASHSNEREWSGLEAGIPLDSYDLARDYGQTLIAHSVARRLPGGADVSGFLRAIHENLKTGESYADWSFA